LYSHTNSDGDSSRFTSNAKDSSYRTDLNLNCALSRSHVSSLPAFTMMTPRSSITNEEIPQQISRAPVPISRPSLPAATPAPLALSRGSRALPRPLPAPINIPTNSRWPAQRLVLYTPESPPRTTRGRFSESGVLLQTASSNGSRARERELSEGSDYEERFYHGGSWSTGSVVSAQHE
jgi:hypothetical protein